MRIKERITVFDAAELSPESDFWAALLGGTVDADDDWHTVVVDGHPVVAVQLAPDHIAPQWPHGTPQQIHLDLLVDDIAAARREAEGRGARLLQEPKQDDGGDTGFVVYADPAGHPFCLCW